MIVALKINVKSVTEQIVVKRSPDWRLQSVLVYHSKQQKEFYPRNGIFNSRNTELGYYDQYFIIYRFIHIGLITTDSLEF